MKTLYVHIGTPKTASTSIQSFCHKNMRLLNRDGFYYPFFQYSYAHVSKTRNAHFLLGYRHNKDGTRNLEREAQVFRENFEEIYKGFESYDKILLTDESMWVYGFRNEETKECAWDKLYEEQQKGKFAVKVIVYLRPQYDYLFSLWDERVKTGYYAEGKQSWKEMIADLPNYGLDYYERLEKIAKYFGAENVIVREFDRSKFRDGDICKDFLYALGIENVNRYYPLKDMKNISLTKNDVEIKRILNKIPDLDRNTHTLFFDTIQETSAVLPEDKKMSMFTEEEAKVFHDKYAEGNKKIATDFMGMDETIFPYSYAPDGQWIADSDMMLEDVVLFMGQMMMKMNQQIVDQQRQINSLKSSLKHPVKTAVRKVKEYSKKDN